jgi:acid phosphatase class B
MATMTARFPARTPLIRVVAGVLTTAVMFSGAAVAHAEVVPVDPGKSVSAGKPISGTGQNLPSLGAQSTWNIGANPADYVNTYYSSGAALNDQRDVALAARTWSKKWVREACEGSSPAKVRSCKAAAVFDIDDTLLSSYPTLSTNTPAFTFSQDAFNAASTNCSATVIEPVKRLYLTLQRMGVAIVLLTGRSESLRESTSNCLRQAGINNWENLILKQPGDTDPAAVYKAKARKALMKAGWRIGPSVGDQISDMSLGSLEHGFLIPNPMYLIP